MPIRQTVGFGAAGDHHVGIVERDQARGIADGMRAGRAGGDHRMVRTLEAVADRNMAGGQVDQAHRNEEGRDAARAVLGQRLRGVVDGRQAADAGTDHDAGPLAGFFILGRPAGILHRLGGGSQRVDDEIVHAAAVLRRDHTVEIELMRFVGAERDHAGDLRGKIGNVEMLDGAKSGNAIGKALPVGLMADAQGGHHA